MFDKLLTCSKFKRKLKNREQKGKKTCVDREGHWVDIKI